MVKAFTIFFIITINNTISNMINNKMMILDTKEHFLHLSSK